MKTSELDYHLPPELIAQQPTPERTASRLLVLDRTRNDFLDRTFAQLGDFLKPGDCLVLNNTRVIPARFYMKKTTGAVIEGLFLSQPVPGTWEVLLKNSRRVKPGDTLSLLDRDNAPIHQIRAVAPGPEGRWTLALDDPSLDAFAILEKIGIMPLPPYIKRKGTSQLSDLDRSRYQTVYADQNGAVAAPTAGLHFTPALIDQLKSAGITFAFVTLHVGIGTFKPVIAEDLSEHHIHSEFYRIDDANAQLIRDTKSRGGRIIAVGTTSVRTLETVGRDGTISAASGNTSLFITPGFEFKVIDGMITNFHLPRSTLLALVGAFAGMKKIMSAYAHAVENRYRFFSYGDAMLII